jgi:hypothetical protein
MAGVAAAPTRDKSSKECWNCSGEFLSTSGLVGRVLTFRPGSGCSDLDRYRHGQCARDKIRSHAYPFSRPRTAVWPLSDARPSRSARVRRLELGRDAKLTRLLDSLTQIEQLTSYEGMARQLTVGGWGSDDYRNEPERRRAGS